MTRTARGVELSTRQLQILGLLQRGATIEYDPDKREGPTIRHHGDVIVIHGMRKTTVKGLAKLGLIQELPSETRLYAISEKGAGILKRNGKWQLKQTYWQAVGGRKND